MKRYKRKSFPVILIVIALALISYYAAQNQNAEISDISANTMKVTAVSDGDTFTGLTSDNEQVRVRIHGIDAPESRQAFGTKSKQYLSDLIFGKTVDIKIQSTDRYGRTVAWVYTPDGKDAAAEMLKAGMAWHYKQHNKSAEYAELEQEAQKAKRGLWADKNPVAPWEFRRQK